MTSEATLSGLGGSSSSILLSIKPPGLISAAMADDGKKKKIALFSASLLLVAAVVGTVAATLSTRGSSSSGTGQPQHLATSVKSIQSICQPTDYKDTCVKTLTEVAGNTSTPTSDPKQLVQYAFQAGINYINNAINHSTTLQALAKDPSTSAALKNCKDLLDYAIDDLKRSISKLSTFDYKQTDKAIDDIMVWLSATVTYQETCLDGFDNATSQAALKMKLALNITHQLSSNALAMTDQIAGVLKQYDLPNFSRRLLSEDGIPDWVSSTGRNLLQAHPDKVAPDAIVSKDGTGKFNSINAALKLVPKNNAKPFIIYIKAGVYKEKVTVDKYMTNVVMIGDGPTKTKITGSLNFIDGVKTFETATFTAIGNGFVARNIGFENSAGAAKHQAVALLVQSDNAVFYKCQMDGYQDTLYAHSHRQFYRECTISGTIDFIFGDAASYFQNCQIIVRKPLDNQQNIVTAQGRKERRARGGIVLQNCTISADPEYEPVKAKNPTYLGRPWKDYSRTFIMQSQLNDLIHPDGWLPWDGQMYLNTLTYSEFDNRGPGADTSRRVKWKGIRKSDATRAQKYTTEGFFRASTWLPQTRVPFTLGLLPTAGGSAKSL